MHACMFCAEYVMDAVEHVSLAAALDGTCDELPLSSGSFIVWVCVHRWR